MKKMKIDLVKKRNTILLICLAALFGTGCFKFNEPGVSQDIKWVGNIREKKTNTPIPNATIYLFRSNSSFDPLSPSSYSIVDTFYAKKDGSFSFTYFDDVDYVYVITAGASKYYTSTRHGALGTRTSPHVDIELDPYAWIKFHVKNVNPYDDNDKISINSGFFPQCIGSRVDTTFIEDVIGNQKFTFTNFIYRNNQKTIARDTINFVPAHDTIFHEILY